MTLHKLILPALAILIAAPGCKKDAINVFDSSDYIYVNLDKQAGSDFAQTSYTFTFDNAATTSKHFSIPVKVAGRFSDKERSFNVSVVDSMSTARSGEHYTLPASQVIAGEKGEGNLFIDLHRTADMTTNSYTVTPKLLENSQFKTGPVSLVKVMVTDRLIEPNWWKNYTRLLGVYSDTKCRLWLEFMNISDGTDPFSYEPYVYILSNGMVSYKDSYAKTAMMAFRTWLINDKQNPYDTKLNMTVVASLGTSF